MFTKSIAGYAATSSGSKNIIKFALGLGSGEFVGWMRVDLSPNVGTHLAPRPTPLPSTPHSYTRASNSWHPSSGPMTRIGAVAISKTVYGLQLNPLTNSLYAGFSSGPPDAQMFTTSAAALPISVGDITYGEGDAIYTSKVQK